MSIPDPGAEQSISPIPQQIAERSQEEEAPELTPLVISFARYNKKECGLDGMDNKRARKTLQIIRDIGVGIRNENDLKIVLPKLKVEIIKNENDYRKLYRGMSDLPDVEIKEAKIDADKGRLFFFMVDAVFYIIAIVDSHYETDKQRR